MYIYIYTHTYTHTHTHIHAHITATKKKVLGSLRWKQRWGKVLDFGISDWAHQHFSLNWTWPTILCFVPASSFLFLVLFLWFLSSWSIDMWFWSKCSMCVYVYESYLILWTIALGLRRNPTSLRLTSRAVALKHWENIYVLFSFNFLQ